MFACLLHGLAHTSDGVLLMECIVRNRTHVCPTPALASAEAAGKTPEDCSMCLHLSSHGTFVHHQLHASSCRQQAPNMPPDGRDVDNGSVVMSLFPCNAMQCLKSHAIHCLPNASITAIHLGPHQPCCYASLVKQSVKANLSTVGTKAHKPCCRPVTFKGSPPLRIPPGYDITIDCNDHHISTYSPQGPLTLSGTSTLRLTRCRATTFAPGAAANVPQTVDIASSVFGNTSGSQVLLAGSELEVPCLVRSRCRHIPALTCQRHALSTPRVATL
jgi:hypothetical protein